MQLLLSASVCIHFHLFSALYVYNRQSLINLQRAGVAAGSNYSQTGGTFDSDSGLDSDSALDFTPTLNSTQTQDLTETMVAIAS